jgi:hypothetical protein
MVAIFANRRVMRHPISGNTLPVIASEAKQSMAENRELEDGLLRRFAPPNDENWATS